MTGSKSAGGRERPGDVRAWIEERIRDGVFQPGERLDEQEICLQFGVSRTPVREALLQLASINLVTFQPRQGAMVARMSVREIVAMWEALTCLEGYCAGLAARRMTPAEVEQLKQIHDGARALLTNGNIAAYADANQRFHEAIYAGCRNDYLANQAKDIRSRLQVYRRYPFARAGGVERSFAGHDAVTAAIVAGNDEAATKAMHDHVAGAVSFIDMVAELPADRTARDERPPGDKARPAPAPARAAPGARDEPRPSRAAAGRRRAAAGAKPRNA